MLVIRDINFPKKQISREYEVKVKIEQQFITFENKLNKKNQNIYWSE